VPSNELGEETLALEQVEGQVEESPEGEVAVDMREVAGQSDLDIESLSSLINQAAEKVQSEKEETSFETDPDTGLSLQGARIEELKSQLESLRSGEYSDTDNEVQAGRSTEKEILLANLEVLNNIKIAIDKQIQDRGESLEDLMKVSPELAQKLELLQSQLTEAERIVAEYEEETTRQILEARQSAESKLQNELVLTQKTYLESDAELSDRKILLEMGLQDNLTNPDQLFSEQNIQQVLDTYGLKEGLERLEQLRTESNEAREQVARDKIKTDIIQDSYNYQNNPDLERALDQDIEAKLKTLQQQNPDSETISKSLRLQGQRRLDDLTNSGDLELQKLAFWFSERKGNKTEAQILAENPNFAKYVEKQTEEEYVNEKKKIIGSQADRQLQQEIDTRIEGQFNRAKTDQLQALRIELTSLQSDEYGLPFDRLDESMSTDKENLRPDEIDKFQTELAQALQDGRVKFEKGTFFSAEDIPAKNQEINKQLDNLLQNIKPLVEIAGYGLQSLDGLSGISGEIKQNKEKSEKRPFGLGKNTAKALEELAQEVSKAMEQYNQLQTEKQSNIDKFQESRDLQNNLKQAYNKLPKYIQDKLSALENPSLDTITQALESGVEEIQGYETPSEISERREQISDLESQIEATQAVNISASDHS
jgi:hypothetical protein